MLTHYEDHKKDLTEDILYDIQRKFNDTEIEFNEIMFREAL